VPRLHGERAGHRPGTAQLRAARLHPVSKVGLHLGQHVVCHGVPGDKKLKAGDIINIDITVIKDGFHGDTSRMFYAGQPSVQARRLCEVTYDCMWRGIAAVRAGARLGDIGHTIQELRGSKAATASCASSADMASGASSTRNRRCCITDVPGTGLVLEEGMTFTIEPMINAGRAEIRSLADGWTIVTKDHSLSAQWEHTVLVTGGGFEVLTLSGGAPPLPDFLAPP
jgi:methionyl aminopeptidase